MENKIDSDIRDISLASQGKLKIQWAGFQMPVLRLIREKFKKNRPLFGITLGACLHVTSETANLAITLKEAGAKILLCASNPLSTQDEVAASLVKDYHISVFAIHGENNKTYYSHIDKVLSYRPQITMDDGADLVNALHRNFKFQISNSRYFVKDKKGNSWQFFGSSEETTTGVIRLKAMAKDKVLKIPVIAVNDSDTKHLFDNRYGTGQSTVDGLLRATNLLLAGKKTVVCGYGWCGRGIAARLRGMGSLVTICEVDPIKALEAVMDGFNVDKIENTLEYADIFISATGDKHVISLAHLKKMKDKAIVANSGHFNVEIDYDGLVKLAKSRRVLRQNLEEFVLPSGKKIFVLGEGRLVNLVAAEGHPAEVMDMSFANQALAARFLIENQGKLEAKVYTLPAEIDKEVAKLKLDSMNISFDKLTKEQRKYLSSWQEGT